MENLIKAYYEYKPYKDLRENDKLFPILTPDQRKLIETRFADASYAFVDEFVKIYGPLKVPYTYVKLIDEIFFVYSGGEEYTCWNWRNGESRTIQTGLSSSFSNEYDHLCHYETWNNQHSSSYYDLNLNTVYQSPNLEKYADTIEYTDENGVLQTTEITPQYVVAVPTLDFEIRNE